MQTTILCKKRSRLTGTCNVLPAVLTLIFIMSLAGCDKNGDSFRNETRVTGKINYFDIVDARALVITGDGAGGGLKSSGIKSEGTGNSLFKITEDGFFQEIRYYQIDTIYIETEEGIEIEIDSVELTSSVFPVNIFDVSDDYLIACFNEVKEGEPGLPYEYNYLVRKSDGAVYIMPGSRPTSEPVRWTRMFANEDESSIIQSDLSGNIYYLGNWDLHRLNLQNPDNLTLQKITSGGETGEGVMNFRVNGNGNIIFLSGGITTPAVTRIRYSSGALEYPEKSVMPFWVGFDHNFYFAYGNEDHYPQVERISLENGSATYLDIGIIDDPGAYTTRLRGAFMFKMRNTGKIVAVELKDDMARYGKIVTELFNNEGEIRSFPMDELGITSVSMGVSSPNHYYLSGMDGNQPVLLKVDPSVYPHGVVELFPRGSHEIYRMVVTSDDYVAFHALRMSDGKIIVGEISPAGIVTELEEIGNELLQIVRIQ